jgi:hypothetical protein
MHPYNVRLLPWHTMAPYAFYITPDAEDALELQHDQHVAAHSDRYTIRVRRAKARRAIRSITACEQQRLWQLPAQMREHAHDRA